MKELMEKRNGLLTEMEGLVNKAKQETRAFDETETNRVEEIKKEIRSIDATLKIEKEMRSFEKVEEERKDDKEVEEKRSQEEINEEELRAIFTGQVNETRATAMNTTTNADGGFVVNRELTGEIIKEIKDRSEVIKFFDSTSIAGICRIPKKSGSGTATWVDEQLKPNSDSTSTTPTLDILELGQNRLYRESALTQQMLNSQEIDLKAFVLDDISETMGDAIEDAIFNGDGIKKPTGLITGINAKKKVNLAVRGQITFDDVKKCKGMLKREAQKGASWFMAQDTYTALDLIKDGEGRYILQPDATVESGYRMLGLPIVITDAIPTLDVTGAKAVIVLANPKAYHTNLQKSLALYIYDDSAYKRAGLVGYGADVYMDGKVKDDQRVTGIFNKA
ncbi:phage major capsid protein [Clostridium botulinum]|uniref:phage major capsid protein n=1 Tax=Clostridium botulinum TaxID=1491 RepID=UPI002247A8A1|nr:phage major capsid protein [Clostridium botulinum]UZP04873.1 phage major capsid protein [Clostridium botulinum]UZP08284.1 phage major capsid protein [Clostridium botulinum]UZP11612.1 phage major capsid protein [Clostridium botulinum]